MSSLVSTALRLTAKKALIDATYADERIHDSAITPIDHMVSSGEQKPFIVISTEDEKSTVIGRDVIGGNKTIDLVFEIAIAHAVKAEGDDPETEIIVPATDAGLELSLALITRQMNRALFEQEGNQWCDLFRRFCINVKEITNRRGVGNEDGARFAARQIILTVEGIDEPSFGHQPQSDDAWGALLDQMDLEPDLASITPLFRAAIIGEPPIEDWDRGRSDQGLTYDAANRIGLGAGGGLIGEEPPEITEGTLEE